jgi:hypothetical protein
MKIKYSELKKMVVEEMKSLGMLPKTKINEAEELKSVEDAEKDAVEIEPGEEGRHNEMPIDPLKARKIKEQKIAKLKAHEAKLAKALGETRALLKKHVGK